MSENHYVDNKEFLIAMSAWLVLVKEAQEMDEGRPPLTEYIATCFLKIAENLSRKANFIKYSYRDDMIGDAIENCILYAHNFNPEKSSNPFSYFTQIIYFAFLRRIEKEKKQLFIKYKLAEEMDVDGTLHQWYKENYFEKDTKKDAMKEHFQLNENDLVKFKGKKKTK
jgi:DNA-directed RNA polymerase specialized sigma24 family protein